MNRLLLLLPLIALACRPVGPTYVPPSPSVPSAFTAPGGTAALSDRWCEAFGDPQLNDLVRLAQAQSPDLQIAESRWRQARALQGVQEAVGGPQLGVGAQVSRDQLSLNGEQLANLPFKGVKTAFTNYQLGFDASWEIDLFGHSRRLAEAAQARAEASAERLRDAGLVLAAEVARTYVEYRVGQRRLVLAQENLKNHEDLVHLTTLQASAGEVTELEVQRAQASRRVQEASLADLRLGLRQSLAALSTLTALPLADLETRLGPGSALPLTPEAPAAGLPSDLLRRRPDVRVADRDLAAASADVGVAMADRYPRFSLVGTGGWASVQSGTLLENASRTWSVGPQLHLPLFNSGRLKSQVKASEAAYDAASASYRKTILGAVADTEVALTRMARSEDRRHQLEEAEARQRRLLTLTERQWQAGEVSKLVLLDARRNLFGQEDLALQAKSQSLTALIALCKALGGGWPEESEQAVAPPPHS
jgi:NodT family efflux transporter outer membrane factor (OMF) lipoprotein